jgi:hypothetical protein
MVQLTCKKALFQFTARKRGAASGHRLLQSQSGQEGHSGYRSRAEGGKEEIAASSASTTVISALLRYDRSALMDAS